MKKFLLLIAVGLISAGCSQTGSPSLNMADSGISGQITLGPTCPVERIPPDPNCADKPYQATVKVETVDGSKVLTQFTSGSDGNFKVSLNPGTYLLAPANTQQLPRGTPQQVTVQAHQYTKITISYDTGIR